MKNFTQLISFVPFLDPYPFWIKVFASLLVVFFAVFLVCLLLFRPSSSVEEIKNARPTEQPRAEQKHNGTGDNVGGNKYELNNFYGNTSPVSGNEELVRQLLERRLTKEEKEFLVDFLKPYAAKVAPVSVVSETHDGENIQFARQWVEVLNRADWKASPASGGSKTGIIIYAKNQNVQGIYPLFNALKKIGRKAKIEFQDMADNYIQLHFGYKEITD